MDSQWYVYKNLQVEGPFTWDELIEMVNSGGINAEDLVWNNTSLEWREAAQVPGLVHQDWPTTSDPSTPVQSSKFFFSISSYPRVALIMAAVFLFSLSATSIYLYLNRDSSAKDDEAEVAFPYDTIFEANEASYEQDKVLKDPHYDNKEKEEKPLKTEEHATNSNGSNASKSYSTSDNVQDATDVCGNNETVVEQDSVQEETISWSGGTYTGPLLNEEPHGQGRWRHPDGRNYVGDFEYGEITGYGTMIFAGGEKYTGSFLRGKAHGDGTMTHPNGKKYTGEFQNGIIEGYGIMTFPGGEKYTGYFKNGVGHGKGTMAHPDGRSVSGTWTNGRLTDKD